MKKSPRKGDFYALEMARERVNKRIHGGNGNFDFLMISQKKWISKLFLILCSIKTGQITLFRAGEYS